MNRHEFNNAVDFFSRASGETRMALAIRDEKALGTLHHHNQATIDEILILCDRYKAMPKWRPR